ncbi:MAG: hypothetical protein ACRELY_31140 [Polyangiaceae bacterium]
MKIRFVSAVSLAVATAGALFACKSSDNGGTAGACQSYGNALIAYQQRCGGNIDPSRQSEIAARYAQLCTGVLSLPGIPDLSAQLGTCASNLPNASCNESVDQVDGCDIETNGTLADGATCSISEQCQSGTCTLSGGASSGDAGSPLCGTCSPAIPDGADCSNGNCVSGDVCNFNNSGDGGFSAVCEKKPAPGGIGATCAQSSACTAPNHCEFAEGTESGTCTAPVASGGACTQSGECASGLVCTGQTTRTCGPPVAEGGACTGSDCASGLACDFSSLKCVKIRFAAAGAGCDENTVRCSQGNCVIQEQPGGGTGGGTGTGSLSGTCPTIVPDGQACSGSSSSSSSQCDDFANCYNGTCVLVPAACK